METAHTDDERIGLVIDRFAEAFGRGPAFVARAPGRVNLIGEHTDYNGGLVLPMAIERSTLVAAGPAAGGDATIVASVNMDETVVLDRAHRPEDGAPGWVTYVGGVFDLWPSPVGALDVLVDSNVPIGAGLASSAALTVGTALVAQALAGTALAPLEIARLCRRAEHERAGVPCGIMDPLVVLLGHAGHAVRIDGRTDAHAYVRIPDDRLAFLIVNSMAAHALRDGAYALRRSECAEAARRLGLDALADATSEGIDAARAALGPVLARRARHVVTECARVRAFEAAIVAGDEAAAGAILVEGHRSLRDDFEVSTPELDALVDAAVALGPDGRVYGCRMTGGGFGGCVVALVDAERAPTIAACLSDAFARVATRPDVLIARPAGGAEIVHVGSG